MQESGLEFGLNHNYVLRKGRRKLSHAADLYAPNSGRWMEVWTTQPAIQLYTAGYLESIEGKNGVEYGAYHGLCLEGQHFPDAPNHLHFPTTILKKGKVYEEMYCLKFGVK